MSSKNRGKRLAEEDPTAAKKAKVDSDAGLSAYQKEVKKHSEASLNEDRLTRLVPTRR